MIGVAYCRFFMGDMEPNLDFNMPSTGFHILRASSQVHNVADVKLVGFVTQMIYGTSDMYECKTRAAAP